MTVQECARAQGFPDYYEFLSVNETLAKIVEDVRRRSVSQLLVVTYSHISQQHRQIGNAVPVPLALALGKSLGQALLQTWQEKAREGSPEV